MRTSEILSKTLELWGPNGERWIKGHLSSQGHYCLIGAITKVTLGNPTYMYNHPECEAKSDSMKAYSALGFKAQDLLSTEAKVANYNDGHSFKDVKERVCSALKQCLEDEANASQESKTNGTSSGATGS